jgi:hypothetical protein
METMKGAAVSMLCCNHCCHQSLKNVEDSIRPLAEKVNLPCLTFDEPEVKGLLDGQRPARTSFDSARLLYMA